MNVGDFVEITAQKDCSLRFVGSTGYILSINGKAALVQLLDDRGKVFKSIGEPQPFPLSRLFKLPTPKQIGTRGENRKAKHFRQKRKEDSGTLDRPGNPRVFRYEW